MELLVILGVSWLAGFASFLGGGLSKLEGSAETEHKQEFIHGVVAFGGGILVSAIAFALTPPAMEHLGPWLLAGLFLLGGLVFCYIDASLARHGGPKSQFMAMLMDFLPEAISLGAVFVNDRKLGVLLGLFIGAQNLPEGFNAYREMTGSGVKSGTVLKTFFAVSFLGPLCALTGYLLLESYMKVTAGIMAFAAGGILFLIFQDIAPQSLMKRKWPPAIGAVVGFMVGMLGAQLLH